MAAWVEAVKRNVVEEPRGPIKIPHGTHLGGADGGLYEVFAPRWWRLDLWLRWWFGKRAKGVVTFFNKDGEKIDMDVWESKIRLPRVGSTCAREAKPESPTISKL